MKKRFLSLFLVIAMLFTMFPAMAFGLDPIDTAPYWQADEQYYFAKITPSVGDSFYLLKESTGGSLFWAGPSSSELSSPPFDIIGALYPSDFPTAGDSGWLHSSSLSNVSGAFKLASGDSAATYELQAYDSAYKSLAKSNDPTEPWCFEDALADPAVVAAQFTLTTNTSGISFAEGENGLVSDTTCLKLADGDGDTFWALDPEAVGVALFYNENTKPDLSAYTAGGTTYNRVTINLPAASQGQTVSVADVDGDYNEIDVTDSGKLYVFLPANEENIPIRVKVANQLYSGLVGEGDTSVTLVLDTTGDPEIFTVSFDLNGGELDGADSVDSQRIEHNHLAQNPGDPEQTDYIFGGWQTEQGNIWDFSIFPVLGDVELTAKWNDAAYSVQFNMNDGTNAVYSGPTDVANGGYAVAPNGTPQRQGYIFKGWYTTPEADTSFNFQTTPITQNTFIYAGWAPDNIDLPGQELTEGTYKVYYSHQLVAQYWEQWITGEYATSDLTFGIIEGELPVGMALNANTGVISGYPHEVGDFTFTVRVQVPTTGGASRRAEQDFVLSINQRPITVQAPAEGFEAGKVYGENDGEVLSFEALTEDGTTFVVPIAGTSLGLAAISDECEDVISAASFIREKGENVGEYDIYLVTDSIVISETVEGTPHRDAVADVTDCYAITVDFVSAPAGTTDPSTLAEAPGSVGAFTISQRPFAAQLDEDADSKIYGENDPVLTAVEYILAAPDVYPYHGLVNATVSDTMGNQTTIQDTLGGVLVREAGEDVGLYDVFYASEEDGLYTVTITITDADGADHLANYQLISPGGAPYTAMGQFEITQRSISIGKMVQYGRYSTLDALAAAIFNETGDGFTATDITGQYFETLISVMKLDSQISDLERWLNRAELDGDLYDYLEDYLELLEGLKERLLKGATISGLADNANLAIEDSLSGNFLTADLLDDVLALDAGCYEFDLADTDFEIVDKDGNDVSENYNLTVGILIYPRSASASLQDQSYRRNEVADLDFDDLYVPQLKGVLTTDDLELEIEDIAGTPVYYLFDSRYNLLATTINDIDDILDEIDTSRNADYYLAMEANFLMDGSDAANYLRSFTLAPSFLIGELSITGSDGGGNGSADPDYYRVYFEENGGSSISSQRVEAGEQVDEPDDPEREGYRFLGWYEDEDFRYEYDFDSRVWESFTLYAKWEKIAEEETPDIIPPTYDYYFVDMQNHWAKDAVDFVASRGLMTGMSVNEFGPNLDTTRGMIVTIFHRLAGLPSGVGSFLDVAPGAYYANAVAWGAANGIVKGYGDGNFGPNDRISREQLAAIFYRYAIYKGYPVAATGDLSVFADANKVSDYAVTAMQWAVGQGLVGGKGNGILDPAGYATRAEVAAMLQRFIQMYNVSF